MPTANEYLRPEHLEAERWVALAQLEAEGDSLSCWQDVSVRPETGGQAGGQAGGPGFTVEVVTAEVLAEDFAEGLGPHPRDLLSAGEEAALDVTRMAVYARRPFTDAQALAWTEALLVCAGVAVRSLAQVGREDF